MLETEQFFIVHQALGICLFHLFFFFQKTSLQVALSSMILLRIFVATVFRHLNNYYFLMQ